MQHAVLSAPCDPQRPSPALRPCPHCEADNSARPSLTYSRGQWQLKECGRCQLVYLENPPEYDALEVEFAFEKTLAAERSYRRGRSPWAARFGVLRKLYKRLSGRQKMESLVRQFVARGRILDIEEQAPVIILTPRTGAHARPAIDARDHGDAPAYKMAVALQRPIRDHQRIGAGINHPLDQFARTLQAGRRAVDHAVVHRDGQAAAVAF